MEIRDTLKTLFVDLVGDEHDRADNMSDTDMLVAVVAELAQRIETAESHTHTLS